MGEYARLGNERIKIGTCESMYYLRYEDRSKVRPESGSLNPARTPGLFYRLPFPDEDRNGPGNYDEYNRGLRLVKCIKDPYGRPGFDRNEDFEDRETLADAGTMQLYHQNAGLLLNVPCYHGMQLPTIQNGQAFWNGKGHSFELAHVKDQPGRGLMPVVRCRHCDKMWRYEWDEVLPYVLDERLLGRLTVYASMCSPKPEEATA